MTGFVESFVDLPDGTVHADRNGFVTALAVRTLRLAAKPVPGAMLDALAACACADGSYGFWPAGAAPGWARELPGDADDTAIMALELRLAGRIDAATARRAAGSIARHRIAILPRPGPPWPVAGTFALWHRPGRRASMVDCTATANMLALMAVTGLMHLPGCAQAVATLHAAMAWAGDDPRRAASLSPFYPDPCEFVLALRHAVRCGVDALGPLPVAADAASWGDVQRTLQDGHLLCSSPYGLVCWRSPALSAIRRGVTASVDVMPTGGS